MSETPSQVAPPLTNAELTTQIQRINQSHAMFYKVLASVKRDQSAVMNSTFTQRLQWLLTGRTNGWWM